MHHPIERLFIPGGRGENKFVERQITFSRIDKLLGRRADRRKRYAIICGKVCELAQWSQNCSGCTLGYEELGSFPDRGSGCQECGYTGRSRQAQWVPVI